MRQAQEILRMESQKELEACKDNVERKSIRMRLDELNNVQSTHVVTMAKRLALNEYFKCLVEVGEELKDKINQ